MCIGKGARAPGRGGRCALGRGLERHHGAACRTCSPSPRACMHLVHVRAPCTRCMHVPHMHAPPVHAYTSPTPLPPPPLRPAGAARATRLPAPRAHRSRRGLPPPPSVRRRPLARARAAEPQQQASSQPVTSCKGDTPPPHNRTSASHVPMIFYVKFENIFVVSPRYGYGRPRARGRPRGARGLSLGCAFWGAGRGVRASLHRRTRRSA